MRPIYTTFGFVKKVYAAVSFFKELISNKERPTTVTVAAGAQDIGKYIIPIINIKSRRVGNFSRKSAKDFLFCNRINNKQPDAISQNLVGIKKYAADWLIGYK